MGRYMVTKVADHKGGCTLHRYNTDREHHMYIKLFPEGCYISLSSVSYKVSFSLNNVIDLNSTLKRYLRF